jgi:hypothetical protein
MWKFRRKEETMSFANPIGCSQRSIWTSIHHNMCSYQWNNIQTSYKLFGQNIYPFPFPTAETFTSFWSHTSYNHAVSGFKTHMQVISFAYNKLVPCNKTNGSSRLHLIFCLLCNVQFQLAWEKGFALQCTVPFVLGTWGATERIIIKSDGWKMLCAATLSNSGQLQWPRWKLQVNFNDHGEMWAQTDPLPPRSVIITACHLPCIQ